MLLIGAILLVAEAVTPGFFIVVPGTILVLLGIIAILAPELLTLPWGIVVFLVITTVVSAGTIVFYRRLAPGHKPLSTSMDTLVGQRGEVIKEVEPDSISGKVKIGEQVWSAKAGSRIARGEKVIVTRAEGVHVIVCKDTGMEAKECKS